MTVTSRPLTRAYLRDRLRELARAWAGAPCHCGKCLLCVWDTYLHDLALLDDVRAQCGELPEDYHGCTDPWGTYEDDLEMRVAAHEDLLIGNVRTDAQEAGR